MNALKVLPSKTLIDKGGTFTKLFRVSSSQTNNSINLCPQIEKRFGIRITGFAEPVKRPLQLSERLWVRFFISSQKSC